MSDRLTEFPDRRVWNLSGFTLEQIRIGYQMNLLFFGPEIQQSGSITVPVPSSSLWVDIEQRFALRSNLQTTWIVPAEALTVSPMLRLLHQPIASLTAFRSGTLLLTFEDGTEIEVQKTDQYET